MGACGVDSCGPQSKGQLQAVVNAVRLINLVAAIKRGEYFNWATNCETVKEDRAVRRAGQG